MLFNRLSTSVKAEGARGNIILPLDDGSLDTSINWKERVVAKTVKQGGAALRQKLARIDKEERLGMRPPAWKRRIDVLAPEFALRYVCSVHTGTAHPPAPLQSRPSQPRNQCPLGAMCLFVVPPCSMREARPWSCV